MTSPTPPAAVPPSGTPSALPSPSGRPPGDGAVEEAPRLRPMVWVVRLVVGLSLLFGGVAAGAYYFRGSIEWVGQTFVGRFGLPGMALGTFLADAAQFPPPIQFYLLATITGSSAHGWPLLVICIASLAGGSAGYVLGMHVAKLRWFASRSNRIPSEITALLRQRAVIALLLASVSPLPFAVLCWVAGAYRMRYRLFLFFLLLRIPRIFVFYFFIRAGWAVSA